MVSCSAHWRAPWLSSRRRYQASARKRDEYDSSTWPTAGDRPRNWSVMYGLAIRSPVPWLRSQSVSCSAGFPNEIRVVSRVALELNRPPGSPRTNPLGGAPLVELYRSEERRG